MPASHTRVVYASLPYPGGVYRSHVPGWCVPLSCTRVYIRLPCYTGGIYASHTTLVGIPHVPRVGIPHVLRVVIPGVGGYSRVWEGIPGFKACFIGVYAPFCSLFTLFLLPFCSLSAPF